MRDTFFVDEPQALKSFLVAFLHQKLLWSPAWLVTLVCFFASSCLKASQFLSPVFSQTTIWLIFKNANLEASEHRLILADTWSLKEWPWYSNGKNMLKVFLRLVKALDSDLKKMFSSDLFFLRNFLLKTRRRIECVILCYLSQRESVCLNG